MYTLEDIRQIAIQIEQNGEQAYRLAARRADHPEVAKILNWMADEEHRHGEWFANMPTDVKKAQREYQEMEDMGRSLLREMVENKTFSLDGKRLGSATDVVAVLHQSMEFEEDTILFYDMLKAFMDDQGSAAQLDLIIDEERGHVKILKKLREKYVDGVDIDMSSVESMKQ